MKEDDNQVAIPYIDRPLLFVTDMQWGQQPVRLTARLVDELPDDAPTTSVHLVAFYRGQLLLVKDKRGSYGFPGGRLDPGETREQAMNREIYEEANANARRGPEHLHPCRLPQRSVSRSGWHWRPTIVSESSYDCCTFGESRRPGARRTITPIRPIEEQRCPVACAVSLCCVPRL